MSALETLVKLAQSRLDATSREAAEATAEVVRLRASIDQNVERERKEEILAASDLALMLGAGSYRARMDIERDALREQIEEQEEVLAEIRKRLAMAYREKSKFEQLIEQQRVRENAELADLEQKQLDEVAITLNGRN